MDIEQVADEDPDTRIATLHVDPLIGFQDSMGALRGQGRARTWCADRRHAGQAV